MRTNEHTLSKTHFRTHTHKHTHTHTHTHMHRAGAAYEEAADQAGTTSQTLLKGKHTHTIFLHTYNNDV